MNEGGNAGLEGSAVRGPPLDSSQLARVTKSRIAPAVVLGTGFNGLSFLRSLGRRGIPTIAMDTWRDAAAFSRYGAFLEVPDPAVGEAALLALLERIAQRIPRRGVLIPTSDAFAMFVSQFEADLAAHYDLNVPDHKTVLTVTDKKLQYKHAAKVGVAAPLSLFPEESDIRVIAKEVSYPCVLKPCLAHRWRRYLQTTGTPGGRKAIEIRSAGELIDAYETMKVSGVEFMVQEKIPGGDDRLWALQTYLDRSHAPKAVFTKCKLRQYPRGFGDSCFQIGRWDAQVAETGLRLLQTLSYRGNAGVEFKRDPRDDRLKLVEANPRSLATNHHAVVSGVDIPYITYRDSRGEKVEEPSSFQDGIKWVDLTRDLQSFLQYRNSRELSAGQWLRSLRGRRCHARFTWDDPLPAVVGLARFSRNHGLRALADLRRRPTASAV